MEIIVKLLIIFVVGLISGFINVNAGGGSILTLPALIFMGLPAAVANGTNRISVLAGALSATRNFKNKDVLDWKFGLELAVPALVGAVIGAKISITLSEEAFKMILSGVMILVLVAIILNPAERFKGALAEVGPKNKIIAAIAFFFVGFYGGFIQVGVGFLIIAALSLITHLPLVRINALKMMVVLVYTLFSLGVFVVNGKVDLVMGLAIAAGSALGTYLGSNLAIAKGDKWIRVILIVAVIAMVVKLTGIFNF